MGTDVSIVPCSTPGGPCGAVGVDLAFEQLLGRIFGEDFIATFKRQRPAAWVDLTIAFEARKRTAGPHRAGALNISLPFSFIDFYRKQRGHNVETALRRSRWAQGLPPLQWAGHEYSSRVCGTNPGKKRQTSISATAPPPAPVPHPHSHTNTHLPSKASGFLCPGQWEAPLLRPHTCNWSRPTSKARESEVGIRQYTVRAQVHRPGTRVGPGP